jgi:hypothetical protein
VPRNGISKLFFLVTGKVGGGGLKLCERARLDRINTWCNSRATKCELSHDSAYRLVRYGGGAAYSRYTVGSQDVCLHVQELGRSLWNLKIHCWVRNNLPLSYHEPDTSIPLPPILFLKIHCNIIFLSTTRSSK